MRATIQIILVALIIFNNAYLKAQSTEEQIIQHKNSVLLHWDIAMGEAIFDNLIEVDIKDIKKKHKMVDKLFLDNPSDDPVELAGQVKSIFEDLVDVKNGKNVYKEVALFSAKIGVDAFIDLFTSLGAREVNKDRQVKYDVIIEALTEACFPDYVAQVEDYNFDERLLFYSLQGKLNILSDKEKYRLRAMVIAGPTFSFDAYYTADMRFKDYMQDPWMFSRNLKNRFQKSKYRYRS